MWHAKYTLYCFRMLRPRIVRTLDAESESAAGAKVNEKGLSLWSSKAFDSVVVPLQVPCEHRSRWVLR